MRGKFLRQQQLKLRWRDEPEVPVRIRLAVAGWPRAALGRRGAPDQSRNAAGSSPSKQVERGGVA